MRQLLVASEYGEPGDWAAYLVQTLHKWRKDDSLDLGLLLITKNPGRSKPIMVAAQKLGIPSQVHFTITGLGNSKYEPQVPIYQEAVQSAKEWITSGLIPANAVTLRVDPIIPELLTQQKGTWPFILEKFAEVGVKHVRCSVIDYYPHVRQRFAVRGLGVSQLFQASSTVTEDCIGSLADLALQLSMQVHLCAEPIIWMKPRPNMDIEGCASSSSWSRLGLGNFYPLRRRQRTACTCDLDKLDLLSRQKKGCSINCAYCYWRDQP